METTNWQRHWRSCLTAIGLTAIAILGVGGLNSPGERLAADDTVKQAASVADAVKVLDLRTMPLPEEASEPEMRQVGSVSYESCADPKTAFRIQQQQFVKLGWKELPGSMSEATYGSGLFMKSDFVVSVTTSDGGRSGTQVSITNFGNVRLSKLPVIKGAKSLFANDATTMYVSEAKQADVVQATRKLLLGAGWEPYGSVGVGSEGVMMTFKRNAVQILAYVSVSPAQEGKTAIAFSSLLLSADIPAPADAEDLRYVDVQKTLRFESSAKYADVAKYYQQVLGERGWKPTTKEFIASADHYRRPIGTQIFRNAADEMLTLDLITQNAKTHAVVKHLTASELAASEQQAKESEQRQLADRVARKIKPTKPLPTEDEPDLRALPDIRAFIGKILADSPIKLGSKVGIPIPEQAKQVDRPRENVLKIQLAAGWGLASAEFMRDQLTTEGWKLDEDAELDETSGNFTFRKGAQRLTLSFVDTGTSNATIMVTGFGAKLEPAKFDAKSSKKAAVPKPTTIDDDENDDPYDDDGDSVPELKKP